MGQNDRRPKSGMRTWLTILVVFAVGIAIGLFFKAEGRIVGGGSLLILLLLACPLMMLFMMRGTRGDSSKDAEEEEKRK